MVGAVRLELRHIGVHATGQVASFEIGRQLPDRLAERLNAETAPTGELDLAGWIAALDAA